MDRRTAPRRPPEPVRAELQPRAERLHPGCPNPVSGCFQVPGQQIKIVAALLDDHGRRLRRPGPVVPHKAVGGVPVGRVLAVFDRYEIAQPPRRQQLMQGGEEGGVAEDVAYGQASPAAAGGGQHPGGFLEGAGGRFLQEHMETPLQGGHGLLGVAAVGRGYHPHPGRIGFQKLPPVEKTPGGRDAVFPAEYAQPPFVRIGRRRKAQPVGPPGRVVAVDEPAPLPGPQQRRYMCHPPDRTAAPPSGPPPGSTQSLKPSVIGSEPHPDAPQTRPVSTLPILPPEGSP